MSLGRTDHSIQPSPSFAFGDGTSNPTTGHPIEGPNFDIGSQYNPAMGYCLPGPAGKWGGATSIPEVQSYLSYTNCTDVQTAGPSNYPFQGPFTDTSSVASSYSENPAGMRHFRPY